MSVGYTDISNLLQKSILSLQDIEKLQYDLNHYKCNIVSKNYTNDINNLYSGLFIKNNFTYTLDKYYKYDKDYSYYSEFRFTYNEKEFSIIIEFKHNYTNTLNTYFDVSCEMSIYVNYKNVKITLCDKYDNIHSNLKEVLIGLFEEINEENLDDPECYEELCNIKRQLIDFSKYLEVNLEFIYDLLTTLIIKVHYMNIPKY